MRFKRTIICGLLVFLMVCIVPVVALLAVDDHIEYAFGACSGFDLNYPFIIDVFSNDIYTASPTAIEITQAPKYAEAWEWYDNTGTEPDHKWIAYYTAAEPDTGYDGYLGPDTLRYRLHDLDTNTYSNEATVFIQIERGCNQGGDIKIYNIPKDTPIIDFPSSLFFTVTSHPSHGTFFTAPIDSPILLGSYMPDSGFTGQDQFKYKNILGPEETGYYTGEMNCLCRENTINVKVGDAPAVPEFPTIFFPATMILGILGAVLFIQRTRDQ